MKIFVPVKIHGVLEIEDGTREENRDRIQRGIDVLLEAPLYINPSDPGRARAVMLQADRVSVTLPAGVARLREGTHQEARCDGSEDE